jgi:hypothetical protein
VVRGAWLSGGFRRGTRLVFTGYLLLARVTIGGGDHRRLRRRLGLAGAYGRHGDHCENQRKNASNCHRSEGLMGSLHCQHKTVKAELRHGCASLGDHAGNRDPPTRVS